MTTRQVKISDISDGPIRHEVLAPELLERVQAFKKILGDVEPASLEDTIANFKHDAHPEREIAVWERIAATYQVFVSRHNITDYQPRREVFAALLAISAGADDCDTETLTTDQINELRYNF